jgi:hypothetical protein
MDLFGVMTTGRRRRRWIVSVAVFECLDPAILTSHSPERVGIRVEPDPLQLAA